jgi:uncharacterized protein (DUF58 family)
MAAPAASYGALLDAVRGVHWPARRAVSSLLPGAHRSTLRGTSAEFTEYRLYRQGDDPRRVDWRLLARSDRAYIRLANDRAVLPTTIILDTSASMAFPVATRAKWRLAQELAIGLAAVAHADGDPVGMALHDANGKVALLPPRTRRDVVAEIARVALAGDPGGAEPLAPIVRALRSARLVLITDLLGDEEESLRAVRAHIVSGGEAHVAHVVAQEELDPPRRTLLAADPEQNFVQRMLVDSTRREYDERFASWRADVARRWRAAGASYTEVVTNEPASRAIRRIAVGGGGER